MAVSKLAADLRSLMTLFPRDFALHRGFLERVASELERLTAENDVYRRRMELLEKDNVLLKAAWDSLQREATKAVGMDNDPRCPVCNWPMASSADLGCVPGNCSMRK
jgi:hypothetical protein